MPSNYEQAPILKSNGEKEQPFKKWGMAIRTHELEAALCCCLGSRDFVALKTMLFFTGNAEEKFRVAKKTICERMNISEQKYYDARKKLQEMGWIYYDEKENVICINYDRIYSDYKNYLKEKEGFRKDSPQNGTVESGDNLKKIQESSLSIEEGFRKDSPPSCLKEIHNNISNNLNNTIKNKINGGAGAAIAAPPPELLEMAISYREKISLWGEYLEYIEKWFYKTLKETGLEKDTIEYKKKYKELETMANYCLNVMYGEIVIDGTG